MFWKRLGGRGGELVTLAVGTGDAEENTAENGEPLRFRVVSRECVRLEHLAAERVCAYRCLSGHRSCASLVSLQSAGAGRLSPGKHRDTLCR